MKKYLKVISQLLSMVIFVTVILGLSGTGVYDEQKLNAEAIALKLFEQDINPVDQSVLSYDLKSLDGENDYIIATGQDKGYVIFTRKDMQIVEYSAEGSSPFGNLNKSDSYYGGPANYFTKKDGEIENINTKERINKEHLKTISDNLREKTSAKRIDKVEEEKEIDVIKSNEVTAKSVAKPNLNVSLLSVDPGPTGTGSTDQGYVDIDEYQIVSQRYIPNKEYFLLKPSHTINGGTECTVVATQLLLGYNNWSNDGRLIDKSYLNGTEEQRKQIYNPKGLGANDEFFNLLKSYMGDTSDGVSLTTAKRAIERYLDNNTVSDVEQNVELNFYDKNIDSIIKSNVNQGYPIIVGMNVYRVKTDTEDANETETSGNDTSKPKEIEVKPHSVVVYGYQTFRVNNVNIAGYIAHFGWGEKSGDVYNTDCNNVWFNASWADDCLTFQTSHTHTSETYVFLEGNNNYHIMQCDICGRYKANDFHTAKTVRAKYHYEEDNGPMVVDKNYHICECICGLVYEEQHRATKFIPFDKTRHMLQCTICGEDTYLEQHMFKNGNKCLVCSYIENN